MPSLVRFLVALVIVAALIAAAVFYLAYMVQPRTRDMTIRIPAAEMQPKPPPSPSPSQPPPQTQAQP